VLIRLPEKKDEWLEWVNILYMCIFFQMVKDM
jgi:hypothetical protein